MRKARSFGLLMVVVRDRLLSIPCQVWQCMCCIPFLLL